MTILLVLAGIVLCILLSGFFSGSEMAYSSCNRLRLENEAAAGSKRARLALYIADHFDDALGAILIGNNLVNIACSSLGTVAVILICGSDAYSWVATILVTIAVIIFGETIPKITAKQGANHVALQYAYPVRFLMLLLKPLVLLVVFLVSLITKPLKGEEEAADEAVEELQSIIEPAEDEDVLEEEQSELVQNAIEFPDVSASEAMTARVDVTAIDIDDSWEDILAVIENAHYTRIPVYEDSIDHVIGILHMNHFLKALTEGRPVDIRSLLLEPCYVYKTVRLPEVLAQLRRSRQHLAIVVDEYGGTLGVITMEDVLEEVVGEIWDETDMVEDEDIVRSAENEYVIDGDTPISDLLDLLNIREEEFDGESETVGGWTVERFGTFPKEGDSFAYRDYTVTVLEMDDLRVEKVRITKNETEKEE